MKNKGRIPVMFCGWQERFGNHPALLVSVVETKSTVMFNPAIHEIVAGEGWAKEKGIEFINLIEEFKQLSKLLDEALSYGFSQNQEVWRLKKQVKYLQQRIKEDYRDEKDGMAVNTEK